MAPDFTGKFPGRGAWVTASRDAVSAALKEGAFARSFRQGVSAPEDMPDRVEAGLAKSALGALGLARRTGDAVIGFEKVRAALKGKEAAILICASDGAQDGKKKLQKLAAELAVIGVFDGRELSAALGRDGIVHVALKRGAAAMRFLRETRRLEGFRKDPRVTE